MQLTSASQDRSQAPARRVLRSPREEPKRLTSLTAFTLCFCFRKSEESAGSCCVCQQHFVSTGSRIPRLIALDQPETVLVDCSRSGHPRINKTYTFERVYGPAEAQTVVFEDVCPLLTSFLDGYHVCIMAYGQTGSGKSFTMLGPHAQDAPASRDELGILPRAAHELFRLISEDPSRSPGVQVSVVEVYNNGIFDLLASDGCGVTSGVRRRVLTTHEGQEVSGLTHESVHSAEEFMTLVGAGLQLRARQATAVHSDSSRSHLVVTVTLTRAASPHSTADSRSNQPLPRGLQRLVPQQPALERSPSAPRRASFVSPRPQALRRASEQVHAKLQLVDLAGSECAGVSGATGLALRETSSINRSLAALADVLGALSEGRGHVPYRNSRLTHLLQDALGGDAKLQVIVCVSPGQKHVAETLQSLGFGARARQVERGRPAPRKRRWNPVTEAPGPGPREGTQVGGSAPPPPPSRARGVSESAGRLTCWFRPEWTLSTLRNEGSIPKNKAKS
ncbi:kinesin-like protein KIF25 [Phacochoerus africanus]|uniref:kinesin-like protein KIF25 n=1 Tax=Phacochoerus africanus TaxID=41426 RepID=UPI001FDABBB2|nr:kinesin-like protein KIF25 [Phacochoerus africanus]